MQLNIRKSLVNKGEPQKEKVTSLYGYGHPPPETSKLNFEKISNMHKHEKQTVHIE